MVLSPIDEKTVYNGCRAHASLFSRSRLIQTGVAMESSWIGWHSGWLQPSFKVHKGFFVHLRATTAFHTQGSQISIFDLSITFFDLLHQATATQMGETGHGALVGNRGLSLVHRVDIWL